MNSALIIRGGAIGDFVLSLPAVRAFRDCFPKVRLEIMGYSHITELAHRRFYAEAVRSLDHRAAAMFFAARGTLDPDLSRYFSSFDLIVSYLYDPDRIFETNLGRAGARRVVIADGRPPGGEHASKHLSRWLSEAGVTGLIESPALYPSKEDQSEAMRLFPLLDRPTVALHPGSGSPSKNWPVTRFCELAGWLQERGLRVLVMTGPADTDVDTIFWKDRVAAGCTRCRDLTLPVLAAVIQRCAAFVGHDSGISHIAAAVDTPTLAIFGATDPAVWAPRGKRAQVLQRRAAAAEVSLEDVKNALEDWLKKGHERKT